MYIYSKYLNSVLLSLVNIVCYCYCFICLHDGSLKKKQQVSSKYSGSYVNFATVSANFTFSSFLKLTCKVNEINYL